ncbi:MAG: type I methionyl aminopeptidase [Bacilli bacterium]|jgi:methionyl aminopeptidase|nr:type I methionyl aminopeptidase [Bacilli bacterium]
MISIKSEREIELMRYAGHINYLTHEELKKHIKPGIKTIELDRIAYNFIIKHDCIPSQLGFEGYPNTICISINDEVVHGIPSNRKLKEQDIVSIDFCVGYKGYHSDAARTYIVGKVDKDREDLVKNTKEALYIGLSKVRNGVKIGDISHAIESFAHSKGLSVVEELVGHGVGSSIHEEPDIPNFGEPNKGKILKSGMTIAIEPMLNLGKKQVCLTDQDDWVIVTKDGSPSAHFEHTVLVTDEGYEILTGE